MDEELRFHLDARADDLAARRHLAPQDARRLARVEFGSVEKYKEESREARGLGLVDAVRGDLRYSMRQLRAYPIFTAAAVLTLALGIGPNAAMATIISGIFRPLPVADAHEMTVLATTLSGNGRVRQRLAYPDVQDYKSSSAAFSDMWVRTLRSARAAVSAPALADSARSSRMRSRGAPSRRRTRTSPASASSATDFGSRCSWLHCTSVVTRPF